MPTVLLGWLAVGELDELPDDYKIRIGDGALDARGMPGQRLGVRSGDGEQQNAEGDKKLHARDHHDILPWTRTVPATPHLERLTKLGQAPRRNRIDGGNEFWTRSQSRFVRDSLVMCQPVA